MSRKREMVQWVMALALGLQASAESRLWEREPSLWDAAQTYKLTRPLPAGFGVEGPFWNGKLGPQGINLCNGKLKLALWGPCEKLAISVSKNDIWQRVDPNFNLKPPSTKEERTRAFWGAPPYNKPKPSAAGRLFVECDDFKGASQPDVSTSIRDGLNTFKMANGKATGELKYLVTRSDSNIMAISGAFSGITNGVRARLWRRISKDKEVKCHSGSDGKFFWLRCTLPPEKTFPSGFEFNFVGLVVGATASVSTNNADGGIAATAQIEPGTAGRVQIYATVVTMAETSDPFAEAKRRLTDAEARGFDALVADNEKGFKDLYARREIGRIFTGAFGSPLKDIILPFFYMGSWQDRHCMYGNPDPAKYEGDAWYNTIEAENAVWSGLQCFNEEFFTGDFVAGRDESCVYYTKLVNFWRKAWEKHAKDGGYEGMYYMRGYVPPIKNDVYFSWDPAARTGVDWNSMVFSYKMVWNAFDYSGNDETFLKEQVYPGLRNLADFFCSLAKMGADGCYHIEPSCLRENLFCRDALDCIAAAKWVWKTAIEASGILKTDANKCRRWQQYLDKIKPYYLMADGTYGSGVVEKSLHPSAKAGVMIRETQEAGSKQVSLCVTPEKAVMFQHRAETDKKTGSHKGSLEVAASWVRLVRSGNAFTGYESSDGATWKAISTTNIPMAKAVHVGFYVCSHDNSMVCTGRFSHVQIKQGGALAGKDIGKVGVPGSWAEADGVHTIAGSGDDIWGAADTFHYVSATLEGDGEVMACVDSITAPTGPAVQQMKAFNHFPVDVSDEWNLDLPQAERERVFKSCDKFPGDIEHLLGMNPDQWEGPGYYLPHPWLHYYTKLQDGSFTNRMTLDTPFKKTMACWFEPERLCNSRSGTIYLFPCVPSKFDVAFKDMQARGGFLVSAELKNGAVTYAEIKVRRAGECKVINPWPGKTLKVLELPGRKEVKASRDADGERYRFAARAGCAYELSAAQ